MLDQSTRRMRLLDGAQCGLAPRVHLGIIELRAHTSIRN